MSAIIAPLPDDGGKTAEPEFLGYFHAKWGKLQIPIQVILMSRPLKRRLNQIFCWSQIGWSYQTAFPSCGTAQGFTYLWNHFIQTPQLLHCDM